MSEKINELLNKQLGIEGLFYIIGLCLAALFLIFLVILAIRIACHIERISDTPAYSLIKSILLGIFPGLYFGLSSMDIVIPENIVIIASMVVFLIVVIWNFRSFGAFGGFILTFVHCLYAFLLVLCVMSIAFIVVAGAVLFIATAASGSSIASSSSSSVPSTVRNPATGEVYHTLQGVNGEGYININGREIKIRPGAYSGRYIDDYGNEYV